MTEPDTYLFQNIFFDPYVSVTTGSVSVTGGPLQRLHVPSVQTLIYKTKEQPKTIPKIQLNVPAAPVTDLRPVQQKDEPGGIRLNLNLLGITTPAQNEGQLNLSDMESQSVSEGVPSNVTEARNQLHRITSQKSGSTNKAFTLPQLKKIARNLNLPALSGKDALANSIRSYVMRYFGLTD